VGLSGFGSVPKQLLLFAGVNIAVENWKPDKECHADQVFHPFDILIVIDQRNNFLHFPYR
jgi:hypothetical protein